MADSNSSSQITPGHDGNVSITVTNNVNIETGKSNSSIQPVMSIGDVQKLQADIKRIQNQQNPQTAQNPQKPEASKTEINKGQPGKSELKDVLTSVAATLGQLTKHAAKIEETVLTLSKNASSSDKAEKAGIEGMKQSIIAGFKSVEFQRSMTEAINKADVFKKLVDENASSTEQTIQSNQTVVTDTEKVNGQTTNGNGQQEYSQASIASSEDIAKILTIVESIQNGTIKDGETMVEIANSMKTIVEKMNDNKISNLNTNTGNSTINSLNSDLKEKQAEQKVEQAGISADADALKELAGSVKSPISKDVGEMNAEKGEILDVSIQDINKELKLGDTDLTKIIEETKEFFNNIVQDGIKLNKEDIDQQSGAAQLAQDKKDANKNPGELPKKEGFFAKATNIIKHPIDTLRKKAKHLISDDMSGKENGVNGKQNKIITKGSSLLQKGVSGVGKLFGFGKGAATSPKEKEKGGMLSKVKSGVGKLFGFGKGADAKASKEKGGLISKAKSFFGFDKKKEQKKEQEQGHPLKADVRMIRASAQNISNIATRSLKAIEEIFGIMPTIGDQSKKASTGVDAKDLVSKFSPFANIGKSILGTIEKTTGFKSVQLNKFIDMLGKKAPATAKKPGLSLASAGSIGLPMAVQGLLKNPASGNAPQKMPAKQPVQGQKGGLIAYVKGIFEILKSGKDEAKQRQAAARREASIKAQFGSGRSKSNATAKTPNFSALSKSLSKAISGIGSQLTSGIIQAKMKMWAMLISLIAMVVGFIVLLIKYPKLREKIWEFIKGVGAKLWTMFQKFWTESSAKVKMIVIAMASLMGLMIFGPWGLLVGAVVLIMGLWPKYKAWIIAIGIAVIAVLLWMGISWLAAMAAPLLPFIAIIAAITAVVMIIMKIGPMIWKAIKGLGKLLGQGLLWLCFWPVMLVMKLFPGLGKKLKQAIVKLFGSIPFIGKYIRKWFGGEEESEDKADTSEVKSAKGEKKAKGGEKEASEKKGGDSAQAAAMNKLANAINSMTKINMVLATQVIARMSMMTLPLFGLLQFVGLINLQLFRLVALAHLQLMASMMSNLMQFTPLGIMASAGSKLLEKFTGKKKDVDKYAEYKVAVADVLEKSVVNARLIEISAEPKMSAQSAEAASMNANAVSSVAQRSSSLASQASSANQARTGTSLEARSTSSSAFQTNALSQINSIKSIAYENNTRNNSTSQTSQSTAELIGSMAGFPDAIAVGLEKFFAKKELNLKISAKENRLAITKEDSASRMGTSEEKSSPSMWQRFKNLF